MLFWALCTKRPGAPYWLVKGMGFEPIQWTSPCTGLVCRILAGCRSTLELPSHIPSLRPHTLSRVECCLWSTVLYTEWLSYWTPCVHTCSGSATLRRVTSLPRFVRGKEFPFSRFLRTDLHSVLSASLLHLYYTTSWPICQEFFEKILIKINIFSVFYYISRYPKIKTISATPFPQCFAFFLGLC